MSTAILATKLYVPPPRPNVVIRPRLIARLDEGLAAGRKLTLISAPAGFGKTTLVSAWLAGGAPVPPIRGPTAVRTAPAGGARDRRMAWLSLEEGDSDPTRFLTYLVAALRA